jgi:acetate CoA/acetoacetate CoA-transferase beta subunit
MGGAMDQVAGAIKVIVAMLQTAKGVPKNMKRCNLPLTGLNCVDMIITEKAVLEVIDRGLVLKEIMPGSSLEDVLQATDAELLVD